MRHSTGISKNLLTQLMTVERRAAGITRFGQPAPGFAIHRANVPCRRSAKNGSEEVSEMSRGIVTETISVYCAADVDVREDDRISIYNVDGIQEVKNANVTHVRRPLGRYAEPHHTEIRATIRREGTDAA